MGRENNLETKAPKQEEVEETRGRRSEKNKDSFNLAFL